MELVQLLYLWSVEKEQAKNNLITQNIGLYPRAIVFLHSNTHTHKFVIISN